MAYNSDSKLVNHLTTYRPGGATVQFMSGILDPYVKTVVGLGGPTVKSTVKSVDNWVDNSLTSVDNYVPTFLRRNPPSNNSNVSVSQIVPAVQSSVESVASAIRPSRVPVNNSFYEVYVHQPIHSYAVSARNSYSTLYNTHGKALVRGSFDPAVGPLNSQLERLVKSSFPKARTVPKEGFSNEMSRSVRILGNAVASVIPSSITQEVSHIADIYTESYINQNTNSLVAPMTAAINGTRILSGEAVQYVANTINQDHNRLSR